MFKWFSRPGSIFWYRITFWDLIFFCVNFYPLHTLDIADRWKFTSLYPNLPHDAYFVWFYSVLFIIDNFWPTTRKIKSQKFWTSIAFFGTLKNKLLRATRSTPLNLKRNLLIYIHKKNNYDIYGTNENVFIEVFSCFLF